MSYYERIQPRCLPPEAYLRLWESAAKRSTGPKYKSTALPPVMSVAKVMPGKEKK